MWVKHVLAFPGSLKLSHCDFCDEKCSNDTMWVVYLDPGYAIKVKNAAGLWRRVTICQACLEGDD